MKVVVRQLLFLSIIFVGISCSSGENQSKKQNMIVHVARAEQGNADEKNEFPFIAKPYRLSELSFRVSGPIDRFEVYAGNHYQQGQIIAEIDPRDFHIRKERAEALYNQSKSEYERIEALFHKNNISASTYEKAKADYTSAKTAFETASNELNDTRLVAPFNGYVGEVYIEKFQDVKATQPVISLVDIDQLRIEAYVTQEIAFRAPDIKQVQLRFDAIPDTTYEARVMEISKSTTRNNLSYLLTAMLPNKEGKLLSGMSGRIFFHTDAGNSPTVSIPQTALCHRPSEGDYVWVVNPADRTVSHRKVTLGGIQKDGKATIISGVQEDEMIAVSGLRFLSDGMVVELSQDRR